MKNEIAKRIERLENQIEGVRNNFDYLMGIGELDLYEELDYRMYIAELEEELNELINL